MKRFEALKLDEDAEKAIRRFPAEIVYRAMCYLYVKETKSSCAIEHLTPNQRRTVRFAALLREAGILDCYAEKELVRLQNAIVEVAPKPDDLPSLMAGWIACCRSMEAAGVHPVVTGGVVGFGFVFLHPFEDGNGRLHRFLIHHALAAGRFGPPGVVFPVSATMLKWASRYDAALEAYSKEMGEHVEYHLDDQGNMTVLNETAGFYRYPNLAVQVEALFEFIQDTVRTEMISELEYMAAFDDARRRMRSVVDMPDRRMDAFLRACLDGKGRLSRNKRKLFKELDDHECRRLEAIVRGAIADVSDGRQ